MTIPFRRTRPKATPDIAPPAANAPALIPWRCRLFPRGPLHRWTAWERREHTHDQYDGKRADKNLIHRDTVIIYRRRCVGCHIQQERFG